MTKLSSAQLQAWYKQFAKELYENVHIDVTRVEDLGRVKNFFFTEENEQDPFARPADFHYAFMDHRDGAYVNPEPDQLVHFEDHARWMRENLNTNVDEEKIRQLYEMSQAGTLMVYAPGANMSMMQQVYTDETGHISISRPMIEYISDDLKKHVLPEKMLKNLPVTEEHPPALPGEPVKEPDPAAFGLAGAPKKPVKPENVEPGWLSWLGYLFGFNTDYAKLKRYEKESATYDDRREKWLNSLDREKTEVSQYLEELWKREAYVQRVKEYLDDHLGMGYAISLGYVVQVTQNSFTKHVNDDEDLPELLPRVEREKKETELLSRDHAVTPQGVLMTALNTVSDRLAGAQRTEDVVRHLVGPRPIATKLTAWVEDRIIDPHQLSPKLYDLPADKEAVGKTKEEQAAYTQKWNALAEIAGFAALSDPDVSGVPEKIGCNREETSSLNYTMILNNLFTSGRSNSGEYTKYLEPAREKGMEAVYAYHQGNAEPLAKLLAQSLRQINREAACLSSMNTDHAMNTLHLTDRLLQTLQSDPALMKAADLKPEELAETQANVALYQVMRQGFEGKQALLEYALYQRQMSDEQIQKAGRDLLFAEIISGIIKEEHNAHERVLDARADRQALMEELGKTSGFYALKVESEMALAEGKTELAQAKQREFEQMRDANTKADHRMNLIDSDRPGHQINNQLMDGKWVEEQKQILQTNTKLKHLHHMPREALGALLASSSKNIVEILNPAPKVELRVKDEAAVLEELQNMSAMN